MGDVIRLCDEQPADPILRKGDLVRLVNMSEYEDRESVDEDFDEFFASLEGMCGIVTEITAILSPDHDWAPGQAMYITVSIPAEGDEGWYQIDSLSIFHIRRIIGEESRKLRGYPSQ